MQTSKQAPGYVVPIDSSGSEKGTSLNPYYVYDNRQLDAQNDSVDIGKISRGGLTTVLAAGTTSATSTQQEGIGFNGLDLKIYMTGTASFRIQLLGSQISGGSFTLRHEIGFVNGLANSSQDFTVKDIPDYFEIQVTRMSGSGTCQVDAMLCNIMGSVERPKWKEYILAWNGESVPPTTNNDSTGFDVYNTDWVRSIGWFVQSNFDYTPIWKALASSGDATVASTVGSSLTKNASTSSWRYTTVTASTFVTSPYGLRLGVRNSDASVTGTFKAHIMLLGG